MARTRGRLWRVAGLATAMNHVPYPRDGRRAVPFRPGKAEEIPIDQLLAELGRDIPGTSAYQLRHGAAAAKPPDGRAQAAAQMQRRLVEDLENRPPPPAAAAAGAVGQLPHGHAAVPAHGMSNFNPPPRSDGIPPPVRPATVCVHGGDRRAAACLQRRPAQRPARCCCHRAPGNGRAAPRRSRPSPPPVRCRRLRPSASAGEWEAPAPGGARRWGLLQQW